MRLNHAHGDCAVTLYELHFLICLATALGGNVPVMSTPWGPGDKSQNMTFKCRIWKVPKTLCSAAAKGYDLHVMHQLKKSIFESDVLALSWRILTIVK